MNSFNSPEARQNGQAATRYQVRRTSLPRRRMAIASSATDLKAGGDKGKLTWPIARQAQQAPRCNCQGPWLYRKRHRGRLNPMKQSAAATLALAASLMLVIAAANQLVTAG